ncbi:arginine--tRNA ligase [Cytophagaceae bacterium ABcell3]|nr:arginine--tRNA ligase [Cytophagaceae bacterium ABcell3]
MNLEESIKGGIAQAFKEIFQYEVSAESLSLQDTSKDFEGSLTFVMFPYLRYTKKSPEESGKLIGAYLEEHLPDIVGYNVIKGFLNLEVSDSAYLNLFKNTILAEDFAVFDKKSEKVMVEYSSPNTNKPLHLGHLRNNFLGYSVSEILKANGYEVVKANLINDRGIHICKSMLAYEKFGNGETPESSGIKGDHLIGKYYVVFDKEYKKEVETLKSEGVEEEAAKKEAPLMKEAQEMLVKWENGDKEVRALWEKMNNWVYQGFEETYKMIGVDFDEYYYESDTYLLGKSVVEEGLKNGTFYKKDNGSVWIDLSNEGLDEKLLLRSDGTSVYITQDMGTADLKFRDYAIDKSVYVVGNEQDYHFNVLKIILKKLGRSYASGIYHLSYGMVDLPSGKMKSREGTVVDADDLIKEMLQTAEAQTKELGKVDEFNEEESAKLFRVLALGALKYFLLRVDPKKRMLFNPKESIEFQGNTGPFIQYTHARISAILRRAAQLNINADPESFSDLDKLKDSEKEVIVLLSKYPDKIKEAAENYSPAEIAQYAYDLAKEYNRFYADVSIFGEENKSALAFRIAFSAAVAKTIRRAMLLLGIEVPERM